MTPHVKNPLRGGDGRSTRWDAHREARRAELVLAAAAAIERHGASAGLAEIAAEAGVSKPVLYRYFADKEDLLSAVARWGADQVVSALAEVVGADLPPRDLVVRGVDAYLRTVEEHRNVFLLVVRHRSTGAGDALEDGKATVAATLARVMGDALRAAGADTGGAEPWAQGLVGLGLTTAEWWLERRTMSREAVAGYLTDFVWSALDGIGRQHGFPLDGDRPLRLVDGERGGPHGRRETR